MDKHKDDNSCRIVRLTFWRSLCTPARLWPALTWSSCPESHRLRHCVWLAVEESRGVKRSRWPSREAGSVADLPAIRPRIRCSSVTPGLFVERCLRRRGCSERATTVWTFGSPAERKTKKCNLRNLEEKRARLARCLHPPEKLKNCSVIC